MTAHRRYRVNSPLVVYEQFETEAVIVHLETGAYYSAEGSGLLIWSWLAEGSSVGEIGGLLTEAFGLSTQQASEAVEPFIASLVADGLVVEDASVSAASPVVRHSAGEFTPPVVTKISDMQVVVLSTLFTTSEKRVGRLPNPEASELYFDSLWSLFDDPALLNAGVVERAFAAAGENIRLRFAGEALVDILTAPLEHLAAATEGSLAIRVWDAATTGIDLPPPPWRNEDFIAGSAYRGVHDKRFRASFNQGDGVFCMLDLQGRAIFHTRSAADLRHNHLGSPFLVLLYWWFEHRGLALVHGGAVGTPEGGVLLTGKGGSGKSTTALACVGSDLGYLNDDYTVVTKDPLAVHSLYSSGKLAAHHIEKFPRLLSRVVNSEAPSTDKRVVYLFRHWPEALLPSAPLRAVVIPRVTGNRTGWEPASPGSALRALAPSTLAQLPGAGEAAFRSMAWLVSRVPSFYLNLGPDVVEIPAAVTSLLRSVSP